MDEMLLADLNRKIEISQAIMAKLDSGTPLSEVLSQTRLLTTLFDDSTITALVDYLIHGLTNVPYQTIPYTDPAYLTASLIHGKLCGMEDVYKLDIDDVLRSLGKDRIPIKDQTVPLSVCEMENLPPPPEIQSSFNIEKMNLIFQTQRYQTNVRSILNTIRAYVYDYVSKKWIETNKEKSRIVLLGPDYRLLTNKLETLETPVGNELLAAIDNLSSSNPAQISLCALGCRNVIIKLGTNLFKVDVDTYTTSSGTVLDVKSDKEKNRLFAYIDIFSSRSVSANKALLAEANAFVKPIYDKGSKGKGGIPRSEAQELVLSTFKFLELLDQATGFEPILALPG
jgi:hypothetical protein